MPPRINIPPVTRALLAALIFQSFISAAIRYRHWPPPKFTIPYPYLTLVPQFCIFYPWTFLTSTFVEHNVFTLTIGGATLYYGGRYLERAWSSRELAKFLALVCFVPNFLTFCIMGILYPLTGNSDWIFMPISGTTPIQISFLVAFSQLIPAHTVTLFRGILSLRVPRFPLVYMGIVSFLSLTPLMSCTAFWLAFFGFITSWTYLRFYKAVFPDLETAQGALRGDASETFAFAEFFPAPAKPAVAAFADQVFEALVAVNLCTPFSQADISAARGDSSFLQRGTPGSARAEAERRRAIALRALDQRLHAAGPGRNLPAQPSGPVVDSQPGPSTQTAMTSQPGQMLGETKFEPDHEDDGPVSTPAHNS